MVRDMLALFVANVVLDKDSETPLHRQLYEQLKQEVVSGRLATGMRIPSTRNLAAELQVSRNTVVNAFEQLLADGYVEGRVGSGTYVARQIPLHTNGYVQRRVHPDRGAGFPMLSRRGAVIAVGTRDETCTGAQGDPRMSAAGGYSSCPLIPHTPVPEGFSTHSWSKVLSRYLSSPRRYDLAQAGPAGYYPLRDAIARYLGVARGVSCSSDQVIIMPSWDQTMRLVFPLLFDRGDVVCIEEPGCPELRDILLEAGAHIMSVPVDEEGLDVTIGRQSGVRPRIIYVSPSHQWPLGVAMSHKRRQELLEWASETNAWVVEDDCESIFRYGRRLLPSLQGMDSEGRVVYAGSFTPVLSPFLRVTFVIVPQPLADIFISARALVEQLPPSIEQGVLAEYITEGYFTQHLQRVHALYGERQAILLEAARRELGGLLELSPAISGSHLVGRFQREISDLPATRAAARRGVRVLPLSAYYSTQSGENIQNVRGIQSIQGSPRSGLLLGYGAYTRSEITESVHRLAAAFNSLTGGDRQSMAERQAALGSLAAG